MFPTRRETASVRDPTTEDLASDTVAVSSSSAGGGGNNRNGCDSVADASDCYTDGDADDFSVELRRGAGDIVELVAVASAGGSSRREREAEERERSA